MNTPLWWYLYKPRHDKGCQRTTRSYRRGLEQTFSHSLQRHPILLTPCSQTSRLRNYTIFFCCLSHTICGTFLLLLLLLLLFKSLNLPAPFIKSLSFLHWIAFPSLLKLNWWYMVIFLDLILYHVQLVYVFILSPTKDYLDYCSFKFF